MKYSKKVATQKIGLVRKFTDEANKLQRDDKVFLSIGVPDFPAMDCLKNGVIEALNNNITKYTPTAGLENVRKTVAKQYSKRITYYPVTEKNILMTAGSQEAIFLLALSTLEKDDEVMIIGPSFFSFKRCAQMMGAKCIEVQYEWQNGKNTIPFESMEKLITNKCKYIYINSPNNPTGIVTTKNEMELLAAFARKHNVYIVSDEVYKDYIYDIDFSSPLEFYENVIVVDSISKSLSATGMRIGWIVAEESIVEKLLPMHQQIIFSTMSIGQYSVDFVFNDSNYADELKKRIGVFKERRDYTYQALQEIPEISVTNGKGAFYLLCQLDGKLGINGLDFCYKLLREKGVVVVPGEDFGDHLENTFRIAYTQDISQLKIGIRRIKELIEELKGVRNG